MRAARLVGPLAGLAAALAAGCTLALFAGAAGATNPAATDPAVGRAEVPCRFIVEHKGWGMRPYDAKHPKPDAEGALSWLQEVARNWTSIYVELIGEKPAPANAATFGRFVGSLKSGAAHLLLVTDGIGAAGSPTVVRAGATVRLVIPPAQAADFRAAAADHARALAAARALKLPLCTKALVTESPTRHAAVATR